MRASAGQDGQLVDVGTDKYIAHLGIALQQVEQARHLAQTKLLQDRGARHVGIHQHHRVIQFGGNAHRQVDCGEALAFTWHGAGHHDQIAVRHLGNPLANRVGDQGAFDHPILISRMGARRSGHQKTSCRKHRQIEVDLL